MSAARELTLPNGATFQGAYEIESELGVGSFGRVYKARQLSTRQEVAIKLLRFRDTGSQAERFRREMYLCGQLSHPNIIRLVDSGETTEGVLYAVFEFVPGLTLRELLAEEGKLGLRETLHLMTQVLDALSCAHARGVVHRDLKPDNIMVTKTGVRRNALVLDFGLGGFVKEIQDRELRRITATQEMMGTPSYAAPEQLRGEKPSVRSDLYSWGLVFLECLTGELAVSGGSAQEVLHKQFGPEPIPIPSIVRDPRLRRLLATVTAKQVEKRDVTIDGLLETLAAIELGEQLGSVAQRKSKTLQEGERRQLTIVCCRLSVAGRADEVLDVEELDRILHSCHAIFEELANRNGGRVAGALADRMMFVFGVPQAREDDARRACRTALQIAAEVERIHARFQSEHRMRAEIRIGIHTGLVISREMRQGFGGEGYDVIGLTPQIATRIEELAAPGQIFVSPETQRLLRDHFDCQEIGKRRIEGIADETAVFRLIAERKRTPATGTLSLRESPLVDRFDELKRLLDSWEQTKAGASRATLITGEPGIGKSRLVRELRRRVPAESWLECRCLPENQDTPLRPIVDLFAAMTSEDLQSLLSRHGFDLNEYFPLFAALFSLPQEDRYQQTQMSPERQRELTLNAILALLFRISEERPVVLAMEDLHWADPTTLELAGLLVRETQAAQMGGSEGSARVCAVLTARPDFSPPWSVTETTVLPLRRLSPSEVEAMVKETAGGEIPPKAFVEQIIRHADGVPLFVEEVTRVLAQSRIMIGSGDLTGDAPGFEIPSTLRDLLSARLDALSSGARETAQLAAVLGREFRYELLVAVAREDESVLNDNLAELLRAGIVYRRRSALTESYVFKHALVRDAGYESLTKPVRQSIHLRVATVVKERFPAIERNRPETLAMHFEHGGQIQAAIHYWKRAGELAMARGAYVESARQLEKGLKLLDQLPSSTERKELELALSESLGTAHLATQGYSSAEVERCFRRGLELCQELKAEAPIKVLFGIWAVHVVRSDRQATAELLPQLETLARRSQDPVALYTFHSAAGLKAFSEGDFVRARDESNRATELYHHEALERFVRDYGYDGRLHTYGWLMWSESVLGYADRGAGVRDEMLALAEESGNPYPVSLALSFAAGLAHDRREPELALRLTERAIALTTEQKLYFWLATTTCIHGWALVQTGSVQDGVGQIQHGLSMLNMIGVRATYSYYLAYLAEAQIEKNAEVDGFAAVEEGLSLCGELLDRFYEAELLRLKGELLAKRGDSEAAQVSFRAALELAQRQNARLFELRAATSLGRLLNHEGKREAARQLVATTYERLTEGFDTHDLKDARSLLSQLS
jgi:TOMM system kinase/cyclase fusion protein